MKKGIIDGVFNIVAFDGYRRVNCNRYIDNQRLWMRSLGVNNADFTSHRQIFDENFSSHHITIHIVMRVVVYMVISRCCDLVGV